MRWNIRRVLTLAVLVGAAGAPIGLAQAPKQDDRVKPAQAAADPAAALIKPADGERMARALALWEEQSARLKTLDVTIERVDKNPAWGEDEHYIGRALLKSPDLAWLDFKKVAYKDGKPVLDKQGKPVVTPYERIICTGQDVWQYRSDTRQIFVYPLEKQAQKRALEEGPLPFLFNFREAEARQRYMMSLVSQPAEDKFHYWIGIKPRLVMDQDAFSVAFVKLDKKLLLPDRIYLIAPDGKCKKDFKLTNVRPNAEVMTENFKGQPYAGWKLIDNRDGKAPAAAAAPQPRPVRPAQPAMKPGFLGGRRN